ncbi:uncharacterized protein HaLaN_01674 [Haematococcus lacustris]|uniref:Uncharacterized protein n=1 Tax=Haematococcus lacustris TaxID=44745 RepID=A0A699Y9R9_HAELA|nr:uncharacterized protein HaLaN_01674 [Haematococcus lacustris]
MEPRDVVAPATQAARLAGLSDSVPATTINKVCSSGMKAVMLAQLTIQQGLNDIVVAGGMESMSNIPHYLPKASGQLCVVQWVLGAIWGCLLALSPAPSLFSASSCCLAPSSPISFPCAHWAAHWPLGGGGRHDQGRHERARKAAAAGWTAQEIVAVPTAAGLVTQDEGPAKFNADKLRRLRPAFKTTGGTVTAGNASPVTDGAAALVLASYEAATQAGLPIVGVLRAQADANQAPEWFTTAPALAVPKVLARAGLGADDMAAYEFNEAFSVVDLANRQLLGLHEDKVNLHGGAVALGHPIGASGARVLVTLLNVLQTHGGRYGCAAICNGGGGASAMVVERWQGGSRM